MKKYLGIIKKETESASGINIIILTRFSDYKRALRKWMKLYPNAKNIIIENSIGLETFFKDFEDCTPVTEEEKNEAKKLYQSIMED